MQVTAVLQKRLNHYKYDSIQQITQPQSFCAYVLKGPDTQCNIAGNIAHIFYST